MSVCASCNAEIIWTITEKGKRMPVDREPVDHGNIALVYDGGAAPTAEYRSAGEISMLEEPGRYVSHFATCEHAERWRRA